MWSADTRVQVLLMAPSLCASKDVCLLHPSPLTSTILTCVVLTRTALLEWSKILGRCVGVGVVYV